MKPLEKLTIGSKVCESHHDDSLWHDEPDPRRSNWIKTTCRKCKSTIGYRPINLKKASRREDWHEEEAVDHEGQ